MSSISRQPRLCVVAQCRRRGWSDVDMISVFMAVAGRRTRRHFAPFSCMYRRRSLSYRSMAISMRRV